jgi:enolase
VRIFRIGVNCDADFLFNKDPKDPNKYEVEGQKVLQTSAQLQDYYLKMIAEHPLLGYIEDAFAENDMEGHRNFKRTLSKKFPHV